MFKTNFKLVSYQIALVVAMSLPASAQNTTDLVNVFSGEWFVFDRSLSSTTRPCAISLSDTPAGDRLPAKTANCSAPVGTVAGWSIIEGQIVLFSTTDAPVISLGGTPNRLTGDLTDTTAGLVIERAQGDGSSAALARGLRDYKCYFKGFTDTCAGEAEIAAPTFTDGNASIEVIVNLNARTQPRRDATLFGIIEQGTQIVVNDCLTASDGVWCRASFGEQIGWLAKTALRQDTWPIVTFVNAPGVETEN